MRHDTGNKLGFLKAVVYFALRRPDLAGPFRRYLTSLDMDAGGFGSRLSARPAQRRRRSRLAVAVSSRGVVVEARRR